MKDQTPPFRFRATTSTSGTVRVIPSS